MASLPYLPLKIPFMLQTCILNSFIKCLKGSKKIHLLIWCAPEQTFSGVSFVPTRPVSYPRILHRPRSNWSTEPYPLRNLPLTYTPVMHKHKKKYKPLTMCKVLQMLHVHVVKIVKIWYTVGKVGWVYNCKSTMHYILVGIREI